MNFYTLLLTLPLVSGAFGLVERANCQGVIEGGYCCNGKIIRKAHNNDYSAANMICCQGDPNTGIDTGNSVPTTCTAGTAVPLTQAANDGSSPTSTPAAGSGSGSGTSTSSGNAAPAAMITAGPWVGAAVVGGSLLLAI